MKAISLGLISSIIFSIVLAKNSSDSESTTGCFGFCRKKSKKEHKTKTAAGQDIFKGTKPFDPNIPNIKFIDDFDPISLQAPKGHQSILGELFTSETDGTITDKVTGFLRREHVPGMSGWYIRPYEEDYEDKIKVSYVPYREYYERKQKIISQQRKGPPPIPDIPQRGELPQRTSAPRNYMEPQSQVAPKKVAWYQKEGLPAEQTLSTVHEEDAVTLNEFEMGTTNEGEETQGEDGENQGEYEETQGEYEETQGEYEENQGECE
ncbi:erythrocyte membrane antigen 1 [Plasmodium vinckei brucechwatti]|uniref:Erythrocyte membrane antigen 1 n=1 Tax=Plasmodium vinckei brucechwatti TaxID=119398 RepID=A0A6V7SUT4_PLAVN|nr:erythrocyte membrane antigen 1 [Plasmodium vinckei brucechwatti]